MILSVRACSVRVEVVAFEGSGSGEEESRSLAMVLVMEVKGLWVGSLRFGANAFLCRVDENIGTYAAGSKGSDLLNDTSPHFAL